MPREFCSSQNSAANPESGAAAADIVGHRVIDIGSRRAGMLFQKSNRRHNLAGLTVTALGNLFFDPGLLDRMTTIVGQALDRCDLFAGNGGNRINARPGGFPVDMYGASAASRNAAAVLGSCHVETVAEHPQQRRVPVDVDGLPLPVHLKFDRHENLSFLELSITTKIAKIPERETG
jgi:hypothetical protein